VDSCIGGPLLLLSVWSWERFPVGRPKLSNRNDYEDGNNDYRIPTWAYYWDVHSEFTSDPQLAYQAYTNEFDNLVLEQVKNSIPSLSHFRFVGSSLLGMARQRCSASVHGAAHMCATPGAAALGTNCVQSSTKNHKQHMHLKLSRMHSILFMTRFIK
jgi:hypothetical protein